MEIAQSLAETAVIKTGLADAQSRHLKLSVLNVTSHVRYRLSQTG